MAARFTKDTGGTEINTTKKRRGFFGKHTQETKDKIRATKIAQHLHPKNGFKKGHVITLCKSCHVKTNYGRDNWIKYFTQDNGY